VFVGLVLDFFAGVFGIFAETVHGIAGHQTEGTGQEGHEEQFLKHLETPNNKKVQPVARFITGVSAGDKANPLPKARGSFSVRVDS